MNLFIIYMFILWLYELVCDRLSFFILLLYSLLIFFILYIHVII